MKYFEAMGVYKKIPYEQAIERTRRQPTNIQWVDLKKADGRHKSKRVAKEFNNGTDQALYAATPR